MYEYMRSGALCVAAVLLTVSIFGGCTSGGHPSSQMGEETDSSIQISAGISEGTTTTTAAQTTYTSPRTSPSVAAVDPGELISCRLTVPYISQEGVLPTGCEMVSAAMLLQYYGYDITAQTLVNEYLDAEPLETRDGQLYGPHPRDAFVGDPWSSSGFGCYAPVVVRMLNKLPDRQHEAVDLSGLPLSQLIREYVSKGHPVLVWVTIAWLEVSDGPSWIDTRTGETYVWQNQEHCMVLTGADETGYYLNDPYKSNGRIRVNRSRVEDRYASMGGQAVAFLPR